ncbi:[Pyruvate dehydrogenase [acetyl-transferring]]-phosphatase 1, mitochondrial, partial [Pseudocercospora fuligena]
MWARALRVCRRRPATTQSCRNVLLRRNQTYQGPHTTYFQQPPEAPKPKRRILRTVLWSTTCFGLGAYGYHWLMGEPLDLLGALAGEAGEVMEEVVATAALDAIAKEVPPITMEEADELLRARSGYSAVGHTCQMPSNMPCEDTWSAGAYTLFNDPKRDWCEWAIFDGHAGPRTAQMLKQVIPNVVGQDLWDAKCMDQSYIPKDWHTISTIKKSFLQLDKEILDEAAKRIQSGGPLAEVVSAGAAAFSGSCALLALYDPARDILRVANVGDSRAVLGTWDNTAQKYVAKPMSIDQTGFNQDEVARLKENHPGEEDIVDPSSGRVHGIAISRAFGDARWKWATDLTQLAHDRFFGPRPRPKGMIKTPPYLTAEPEVMETKINTGTRPDFLIMASDGLWDQLSSEDAVACVQMWLDKNKPEAFITEELDQAGSWKDYLQRSNRPPTYTSAEDLADDDTYFDEDEKCLKWRVKQKHFVVEDEHCGVHLVKNALGGKRRDLFTGVMSVQPPYSRNVRDDITVHVIFFGIDTEPLTNAANKK